MILSQHFGFSPANQKMYDIHHHQRTSQSPSCANQDMQIKSSMIEGNYSKLSCNISGSPVEQQYISHQDICAYNTTVSQKNEENSINNRSSIESLPFDKSYAFCNDNIKRTMLNRFKNKIDFEDEFQNELTNEEDSLESLKHDRNSKIEKFVKPVSKYNSGVLTLEDLDNKFSNSEQPKSERKFALGLQHGKQ